MYADVDGLTMYYEDHGRLDGPPLVLLHGFTLTGRLTWDDHLTALGDAYRLVVPDLRGHGSSNNPDGRSAMNHRQFARDISVFCDRLGIERAAFCGYSSGAAVILNLALTRPDLVAAAVLAAGFFTIPEATRGAMAGLDLLDLADSMYGPAGDPLDPHRAMFVDAHRALGPDHWQMVLRDFLAIFERTDPDDFPDPESLSHVSAPVLVLHGDRDAFFPVEIPVELYRRLPDAELGVLPQTGHELLDSRPEEVRSMAMDFLKRRYPVSSRPAQTTR